MPPQHPSAPAPQQKSTGFMLQGLIQPARSPPIQSTPCAPEGALLTPGT